MSLRKLLGAGILAGWIAFLSIGGAVPVLAAPIGPTNGLGQASAPPPEGVPLPTIGGVQVTSLDCSMNVVVTGASAASSTATASLPPVATCSQQTGGSTKYGTSCTVLLTNTTTILGSGEKSQTVNSESACGNTNADAIGGVYNIENGLVNPGAPAGSSVPPAGQNGTAPPQTPTNCGSGIPIFGGVVTGVCEVGKIAADVGALFHAITTPTVLAQDIMSFCANAMLVPFTSNASLTSWVSDTGTGSVKWLFQLLIPLGMMIMAIAAACRVLADVVNSRRGHGTGAGTILTVLPRFVIGFAALTSFWALTTWGVPTFNKLGTDVYAGIAGPVLQSFYTQHNLHSNVIANLSALAFVGLLMFLFSMLMTLWMLFMGVISSVILAFCTVLAFVAIPLGVWDYRNQMFQTWGKLYIGALLMKVAGGLGIGITFALAGGGLSDMAHESTINIIVAMLLLCGGFLVTARLMTMVMQGSMQHRGVFGMLGMFAGGVATGLGVGALMSSGIGHTAGAGIGAAKVGASGASAAASGAKAGFAGASGVAKLKAAAGGAVAGAAGTGAVGALKHASVATRRGLKGQEASLHQGLATSPQSQGIIEQATSYLPEGTSAAARLEHMAANPKIHGEVLGSLVNGGNVVGQVAAGVSPEKLNFAYSGNELGAMSGKAQLAAQKASTALLKGQKLQAVAT